MNTRTVRTRFVLVLAPLVLAVLAATSSALACVVGIGTTASCTEARLDACLPGGGSFDGTATFACGGAATITVTRQKTISGDTTIDGGGGITISGGGTVGVFFVNSGIVLTVRNLIIADGNFPGGGGASISNGGTLIVTNSTFSRNNSTGNTGGAVLNFYGILMVTNSTFSNNTASFGGGAIANVGSGTVINSSFTDNTSAGSTQYNAPYGGAIFNSGGTLTVTGSSFSGNSATGPYAFGGAIGNDGTLTIANSTFSGNRATGAFGVGGAVFNTSGGQSGNVTTGRLVVVNSTFSGNSAATGGGIVNDGGPGDSTATVTNTIIANSIPGGDCGLGPHGGSVIDGGHNVDDDGTCGFSGTSLSDTNAMLDPAGLADNGGPTQTIALLPGSPAINAGDQAVCSAPPVDDLDQRGYMRPGSGAASCSIGAYEFSCDGACPTTTTTTTSPPTTSTVPTPGPSTGDVSGTYCVRESWSVSVTGSRNFHRSGVVTGTIQVDPDGNFNLIYRHAPPLPFGRTFGGISYDGSEYAVGSQPVLANIAEHITARQFYALVNLAFAQILVPLEIPFPGMCYFPHIHGCLNEEGDDVYSASGTSLSNLQGSGTATVLDDHGFELDFDVSSVAELSPGTGCGETELCDASCQGALSAADQNLQAAAAAAARGTGKIGRTLQALARTIAPALRHAEAQHPRRQAKAFAKVRSRLVRLRKAVARAPRLSAAARAAFEVAIDALLAILPS